MITRFTANHFTVFTALNMQFSSGINLFIGENGTGKTHLMQAIYAACAIINKEHDRTLGQKVNGVFRPTSIGRLVHRQQGRNAGCFTVYRKEKAEAQERSISLQLSTLGKAEQKAKEWFDEKAFFATFIPVKDMLAHAPGFRSLFSSRELEYEEVYLDIIDKAFLPVVRGKLSREREKLLSHLQKAMAGKIIDKQETFYLKNKNGELEFPLLAEGFRKLGLLYRLIQNNSLIEGSILFWDEPEANLNPWLAEAVVHILLELQRMGVQIFVSTHNYILLKEFELATRADDQVRYHSLYRTEEGDIAHHSSEHLHELRHNFIDKTYARLLDNELNKGLEDL